MYHPHQHPVRPPSYPPFPQHPSIPSHPLLIKTTFITTASTRPNATVLLHPSSIHSPCTRFGVRDSSPRTPSTSTDDSAFFGGNSGRRHVCMLGSGNFSLLAKMVTMLMVVGYLGRRYCSCWDHDHRCCGLFHHHHHCRQQNCLEYR